jgi:GntR family transcriptional regulator of vanillate catabolism
MKDCMQLSPVQGSSNTEAVTTRLRELIINGTLPQGGRVTETGVATLLGVSRTPIRLALATLEQEDLVEGAPNRGFRVRHFTVEFMRETIEVRATLEGMAARLAAEKGASKEQETTLIECVETVDTLIAAKQHEEVTYRQFSNINVRFHATIAEIAGNSSLVRFLERSAAIPFRSAPLLYMIPFEEAHRTVTEAQRDHVRLFEAIRNGQGTRAEFLMREHGLLPLAKAAELFEHMNALAASNAAREAV